MRGRASGTQPVTSAGRRNLDPTVWRDGRPVGGPTRSCGFSVLDTGGNWRRCYRSGQVEEGDARGGEGQALAALDRGIACHQDASSASGRCCTALSYLSDQTDDGKQPPGAPMPNSWPGATRTPRPSPWTLPTLKNWQLRWLLSRVQARRISQRLTANAQRNPGSLAARPCTVVPMTLTTAADHRPTFQELRGSVDGTPPALDLVIPVFNEEKTLERSVRRLHSHLTSSFPYTFRITIADNASTDSTWSLARGLAKELDAVTAVHLDEKGRGRALKTVWSSSDARVLAYLDVDLSTDLAALAPLIAPLLSGHSDVAIGTRLARGSRVVRAPKREVISRGYNLILRATLVTRFSDAQCGFKAIRADRARILLPHVADTGWFFDTELLVLAERSGLRIHEVPVDWVDDPDSRVDIVSTAVADLRGIARMIGGLASGAIPLSQLRRALHTDVYRPTGLGVQAVRFATVGVASTLAYLLLYIMLRGPIGPQAANAASLLITAIGNTALNRRFTFSVQGRAGVLRHHAQGLVVFLAALSLTSGSLQLLHHLSSDPPRTAEVAVLVAANLAATLLRFLLMRLWVFRTAHAAPALPAPLRSPLATATADTSRSSS